MSPPGYHLIVLQLFLSPKFPWYHRHWVNVSAKILSFYFKYNCRLQLNICMVSVDLYWYGVYLMFKRLQAYQRWPTLTIFDNGKALYFIIRIYWFKLIYWNDFLHKKAETQTFFRCKIHVVTFKDIHVLYCGFIYFRGRSTNFRGLRKHVFSWISNFEKFFCK